MVCCLAIGTNLYLIFVTVYTFQAVITALNFCSKSSYFFQSVYLYLARFLEQLGIISLKKH